MPGAGFRVEPSDLEVAAERIEAISDSLGHSLRELAGVQHAQNAADSPEVAAAMVAMVDAWGTELANLVVFVGGMAEKLHAAGTSYVCTDAKAADWAHRAPGISPQFSLG
jgi:hypothetical protein